MNDINTKGGRSSKKRDAASSNDKETNTWRLVSVKTTMTLLIASIDLP